MSSKAKKKYTDYDAIKGGSATSIYSACNKTFLSEKYVELREKYKRLKIDNLKQEQELKASRQDSKEKIRLIGDVQKKNEIITKHLTTITQRDNQIKLIKETSVDRGDAQRLEGFIKKKDYEIEELKKQIDETKINNLEHLKNTIHQQNEQIKYLKEGYGKFNVVDESLSKANQELKEEKDSLKEENNKLQEEIKDWRINFKEERREATHLKKDIETLKEEHGELIKKLDEYREKATQLYDLG